MGRLILAIVVAAGLFSAVPGAFADSGTTTGARARLSSSGVGSLQALNFAPVDLSGGSRLTLVSPTRWSALSDELLGALMETHSTFRARFGEIPATKTTLRLMDEDSFYAATGAPAWTNAMYFRGQIIIPLPKKGGIDRDNLVRSIRHEYTHAIIHALSGGRCPGWLDEGLAQLEEGSVNPALLPALQHYLKRHQPVSFTLLQGGFTKLEQRVVAAAYAQSLIASDRLQKLYGHGSMAVYWRLLREGADREGAFEDAFGITPVEFEHEFGAEILRWASEHHHSS